MTDIVLTCQRCGKEFATSEMRGMRCLECAVRLACEQYRGEYQRLVRKVKLLKERGHPYRNSLEQVQRVRQRIARVVADIVLDEHHERDQEIFNAVLADFDKTSDRILVAR